MLGKHSPNSAVSSLSLSGAWTPSPWERSLPRWDSGTTFGLFGAVEFLFYFATETSVFCQQILAVCVLHIVSPPTLAGPFPRLRTSQCQAVSATYC